MTTIRPTGTKRGVLPFVRTDRTGPRHPISKIGLAVLFLILSMLFLLPMYWLFLSGMRPNGAIFGADVNLLPTNLTLDNFYRLLTTTKFVTWFYNSVTQAFGFAALTVAICTMGGFALAKYNFRGKSIIFVAILASQMLPFQMLIVSLFVEIVRLHLVDTYLGAVLPLAAHPIGLFFMRQTMIGISDELLAAARVDGASEFRLLWSVVVPNVRPAIATLFILFTLEYWNNLLWPLIVFRSQENMPLAVGLELMVNQYKAQYDLLLAGSALATLPIILLFLALRRQFMEGAAAIGTGGR